MMNLVTHIYRGGQPFRYYLHVLVEVGVAADVEVPWDLLDCEGSNKPAAIFVLHSLPYSIHLLIGTGLPHELITPAIQIVALLVKSPLLH